MTAAYFVLALRARLDDCRDFFRAGLAGDTSAPDNSIEDSSIWAGGRRIDVKGRTAATCAEPLKRTIGGRAELWKVSMTLPLLDVLII